MEDIKPIAERVGHVGGIESMMVDGRRWFFGFDYSMDMAVSPLIDDPARMAEFASEHMLQTDLHRGRFIFDNLPANWPEVFAALRPN